MTLNDIKKELTSEQIITFIKHLGGSHKINNNNKNEIMFEDICHRKSREAKKYKLYYYKNSQSFYCFTRCGAIGDIYKLTGHILGLDPSESVKYVLKYFNINSSPRPFKEEDYGFDKEEEDDDSIIYESVKVEEVEVEHLPPIKRKNIIKTFIKYYPEEWLQEGITKATMDKYDIRFSPEKMGVIIPHHNISGEVVGVRIRNLEKYAIDNFGKYTPLYHNGKMYNHKLGHNLYGLDKNKKAIIRFKKVIVFEGEKSVLKMDSLYGDNSIAIATCGCNMSRIQMKMLFDLGVEEIIFAFDKQYNNEESEDKWRKKLERLAKPLIECKIKVSKIWDALRGGYLEYKQAPIDKGIETYKKLVKHRIEIKIKQ